MQCQLTLCTLWTLKTDNIRGRRLCKLGMRRAVCLISCDKQQQGALYRNFSFISKE